MRNPRNSSSAPTRWSNDELASDGFASALRYRPDHGVLAGRSQRDLDDLIAEGRRWG